MKATLVIDVDAIEDCDAEVYVYRKGIPYQSFSCVKLRPIPSKKNNLARNEPNSIEDYFIGWNDCLEEIEE